MSNTKAPAVAWVKPAAPELMAYINRTPLVQSLLYDINLLPEQIEDSRRWAYMAAVCEHMKVAASAFPTEPTDAMVEAAAQEMCGGVDHAAWSSEHNKEWARTCARSNLAAALRGGAKP